MASGHVETDYLRYGATEDEVKTQLGAMQLNEAVAELNKAITEKSASRPWWEAMRDEGAE
jgi:hypothetical protein